MLVIGIMEADMFMFSRKLDVDDNTDSWEVNGILSEQAGYPGPRFDTIIIVNDDEVIAHYHEEYFDKPDDDADDESDDD